MKYLYFAALICLLIASVTLWCITGSSAAAFITGVFAVVAVNEFMYGLMRL